MRLSGTFLFLLLLISLSCDAQDILILRNGDTEIKCKILNLTDSIVEYRKWDSDDKTIYTVRAYDVLSFRLDQKTVKKESSEAPDQVEGLLGAYRMGETVTGYVTRSDGEQLHGKITVKDVVASQFGISFTDKKGQTTFYEPGSLKGFGYDNVYYETVACNYTKQLHPNYASPTGTLFLHRLIDGTASLYRIYRIDFNQGTLAGQKYPPLYMGKLEHEFMIRNPENVYMATFGKGSKTSLVTAFEKYKEFVIEIQDTKKIRKEEIPDWIIRFNNWMLNHPGR